MSQKDKLGQPGSADTTANPQDEKARLEETARQLREAIERRKQQKKV